MTLQLVLNNLLLVVHLQHLACHRFLSSLDILGHLRQMRAKQINALLLAV